MGLGMIQFIGGQYTKKQVKSFWSLLSLEDREDLDDIGQVPLEDGQDLNLHQYRKTARKQSGMYYMLLLYHTSRGHTQWAREAPNQLKRTWGRIIGGKK